MLLGLLHDENPVVVPSIEGKKRVIDGGVYQVAPPNP